MRLPSLGSSLQHHLRLEIRLRFRDLHLAPALLRASAALQLSEMVLQALTSRGDLLAPLLTIDGDHVTVIRSSREHSSERTNRYLAFSERDGYQYRNNKEKALVLQCDTATFHVP